MATGGVTQRVQWVDSEGNVIGEELSGDGKPLQVSSEQIAAKLDDVIEAVDRLTLFLSQVFGQPLDND